MGEPTPEGFVSPKEADVMIASSHVLRDFLSNPEGYLASGNTYFHDTEAFYEAFWEHHNKEFWSVGKEAAIEVAKQRSAGFVSLKDGSIHIDKERADADAAIHEAVHKHSSPAFGKALGQPLNEGATEFYSQMLCAENGIDATESYGSETNAFMTLRSEVTDRIVGQAYFRGNVDELRAALDSKGEGTFDQYRKLVKKKKWKDAEETIRHVSLHNAARLLIEWTAKAAAEQAADEQSKRETDARVAERDRKRSEYEDANADEWPTSTTPVDGRIMDYTTAGDGLVLELNRGGEHGVRRGWSVILFESELGAATHTRAAVTNVDDKSCWASYPLDESWLQHRLKAVRITPPD